jgi:O-antigen/teichoic acid export membrane protein
LTLFPGPVLGFFLRDSYSQAGSIVVILAAGYFALIVFGNAQYVLTMTGRHRAVLAVNCMSAVVLLAASIVGASQFGAAGLAAGSALSLVVQNGTLWWLARRELGIWTHIGPRNKLPIQVKEQHLPRGHALQADIIHSAEGLSSSPV